MILRSKTTCRNASVLCDDIIRIPARDTDKQCLKNKMLMSKCILMSHIQQIQAKEGWNEGACF